MQPERFNSELFLNLGSGLRVKVTFNTTVRPEPANRQFTDARITSVLRSIERHMPEGEAKLRALVRSEPAILAELNNQADRTVYQSLEFGTG